MSAGGVSAPGGGLLPAGVCSLGGGGVGIPACTEAAPPPVDRMTHTCKNITLATTSLSPVKIVATNDTGFPSMLNPVTCH